VISAKWIGNLPPEDYSGVVDSNIAELAARVREALDAGDLDAYQHLLAPDVHWGAPDAPEWGCHNRGEVLNWYKAARQGGMGATVNEVVVGTDCLMVGLTVSGPPAADEPGGTAPRWQVLSVKDGRIADICGFDNRDEATARAGISG
jgi:ketosteroid isomerase-like protein